MKRILHYFFCGLAMGAADIVPGISGGTIAFILGVYYKLLASIQAFNLRFLRLFLSGHFRAALKQIPWLFILPLGTGIACSVFGLAKTIIYLLDTHPTAVWLFFFGLIVSSLFIIARTIPYKGLANILPFLGGFVFAWGLIGLNTVSVEPSLLITFASAFVAVCALLLPGISGASILVLLGQYQHILHAVANLNWPVLIVFIFGCACGALSFARVVSAFLRRFPIGGTSMMIGLMVGSLRAVWPWQANGYPALPQALDATLGSALLCCLLGIVLPVALHVISKRLQKPE
jgi:putative membrane protein